MLDQYFTQQWIDENKNPAGGISSGLGFTISWQNGPLRPAGGGMVEANGAFVETILDAVHNRLWFYQQSKFKCEENKRAMKFIERAMKALDERTKARREQGVEGTHEVHCLHEFEKRVDNVNGDALVCEKCGEVRDVQEPA